MILVRPAAARGTTRLGWLDSRHTFSFGDYSDPAWHGYRTLRVLNDDRVSPSTGFGSHPHRDMEIVSIVLDGALEHRDSLGNGSTIRPGDVQRMTAGTGIVHSEWNPSKTDPVHFLQIWFVPRRRGAEPGYAQVRAPSVRNEAALVVSGGTPGGAVTVDADADVLRAPLDLGRSVSFAPRRRGGVWVQVIEGDVTLDADGGDGVERGAPTKVTRVELHAADGAAVRDARSVRITARTDADVLIFDLG